jgi:hypothetical protein
MILALFAAALLSQEPTPNTVTARQLHEGCAALVGHQASPQVPVSGAPSEQAAMEEAFCEVHVSVELAVHAANEAMAGDDPGRTESFCPPDGVLDNQNATLSLARAYVTWFEHHPAAQNDIDGGSTLSRALKETWPCPH